jgi:aspartate kinase
MLFLERDIAEMELRFEDRQVCVLAGFQGISPENRITTLGRGGSDTTAVALAAALRADRCDIYTDVDGVYTSDPRIVTRARKLDKVTYEEMLEMASLGAKVLQTRSVELAMNHGVPVQVLSSFDDAVGSDLPGTLVVDEDNIVEHEMVSGVTYSRDEAKITLMRVSDRPGVAAAIFGPLADANVNVDMIVQNVSEDGTNTDMTFTVTRGDLDRAIEVLKACQSELGFTDLVPDANVVKVSVVGVGMRSHAGVAQRMFSSLAEHGINIQVISTSEIKISVLIAEEFTGRGKIEISRFKGLGEMPPAQLKTTTMDPEKRTLLKVRVPLGGKGAMLAPEDEQEQQHLDTTVETLMGKKPELRFAYIQENARFVGELDV